MSARGGKTARRGGVAGDNSGEVRGVGEGFRVERVTKENWYEAMALEVAPEQRAFVPSVTYSLAKAFVEPDGKKYEPYVVYAGATAVGFYMLSHTPGDETKFYFTNFLIGREHQGRGHGRAALVDCLESVKERFPACEEVYLAVHPENEIATRLYESLGFYKFGFVIDGEDGMRVNLKKIGEQKQ